MNPTKNFALVARIAALAVGVYLSAAQTAMAQDSKWTAESKVDLSSESAKLGYTFGAQIGANLVGQGLDKEIDVEAMTAAIKDYVAGIEPRLSVEDMQAAQLAYQQKLQAEQEKMRAALEAKGAENKVAGQKYLDGNSKKKGVKTTDSGLQYESLREGKGKSPTGDDVIKVHYVGKTIDGQQFDSSYDRGQPANFAVAAVIPGFAEGLQLMKEGGKYRFVIPENLGYGLDAPPSIGPNQTLIFEVELIEVSSAPGKKEG